MVWAIKSDWRYEAVLVVRETDKCIFYAADWRGGRETRCDKGKFLDWRGDEDATRRIIAQLTSASAEYERRRAAASKWLKARKEEILASAIEARRAATPQSDAVHESAIGNAETPNLSEDHP